MPHAKTLYRVRVKNDTTYIDVRLFIRSVAMQLGTMLTFTLEEFVNDRNWIGW